jgi:hypothetical protein
VLVSLCQNSVDVGAHAGHTVKNDRELKDGAIIISKIVA